ncbi:hypothetical protein K1T71_013504 [Dendrolimus kikuchii]|uniref:Uncharacterized protein n=1 Tax=Dendrolimus kikuchii TaxID=765133 RepID=A0ACC1CGM8_9NEOP|nr:hypothetical protein K1T71_013504 [Dendrolimus kikuchii]
MLPRIVTLIWVSFTMVSMSDDSQYCAIRYRRLCKGKGRHVACQFPDPGPGPSCENYTHIRFTKDLQHFILHYINRRRQRIASGNERVRGGLHLPKPEIMTLVEWDRELGSLAQRLADQCHFVHDDCRATVRFPYAGQTVGEVRWRRSSDSEELSAQRAMRRVFDAWWGERRRVEPKHLTKPFKLTPKRAVWGHFTQLAVWNLRAMGCGAVRHGAGHPRLLLVCDFSHTNMLGQRTLVSGPLAPCPIHTTRRPRSAYPLLCAPVRHPQPDEKDHYIEEQYDDDKADQDTDEEDDVPATTPSLWVRKSFGTTQIVDEVKKEDDELIRIRANQKAQTKPTMIDKLQSELKIRNKAEQIKILKAQSFKGWSSKRPNFGDWRANSSIRGRNNARVLREYAQWTPPMPSTPVTILFQANVNHSPTAQDFICVALWAACLPRTAASAARPTRRYTRLSSAPQRFELETHEQNARQRWKQTRARPRRPGASALIAGPTEIIVKPLRRQPPISLMLDKDDVEQLFKDTGFRFSWKQNGIQRAG